VSMMLYLNAASPSQANILTFNKKFDASTIRVSQHNATQSYGDGSTAILVQNETVYATSGSFPEHQLSWNLIYRQDVDPAREHVDVLDLIKLDWISYMPSAVVEGTLKYNDTTFDFSRDGVGYHDHNSGKWPSKKEQDTAVSSSPSTKFESSTSLPPWSASNSSRFPLHFPLPSFDYKWGSVYGGGNGVGGVYGAYLLPPPFSQLSVDYVFFRSGNLRLEFATLCGHSVKIEPLTFANRTGGRREAMSLRIVAESSEWRLDWMHQVVSSAVNGGGTGLGLVVWEQLSMHNVTLTSRQGGKANQAGDSDLQSELRMAPGFTEWSAPA